jgi:hypothetical protein
VTERVVASTHTDPIASERRWSNSRYFGDGVHVLASNFDCPKAGTRP